MDTGYSFDLEGGQQEFPISKNMITKARKTEAFLAQPEVFCALLRAAIKWHKNYCEARGIKCFVRLNVLSDIPWEVIYPELLSGWGKGVVFYDYTKIPGRVTTLDWNDKEGDKPYHLTYSFAGGKTSLENSSNEIARGVPAAFVFYMGDQNEFARTSSGSKLPWSHTSQWQNMTFGDYPVYDGDCHDLRPLDPSEAMVVGLQYKPPVKKDLRPKDPKKSAFLVYAEQSSVFIEDNRRKLGTLEKKVWLVPGSSRQLGADLFLETDPDSP